MIFFVESNRNIEYDEEREGREGNGREIMNKRKNGRQKGGFAKFLLVILSHKKIVF